MKVTDEIFDAAEQLNDINDGWTRAMGIRFVKATRDEVIAELTVGPEHRQPYGIVHGGVHAGLIETVASAAAAIVAMPRDQAAVGLENHTSFLHAVRDGVLRATGRPLTRGRRTQVWEVVVRTQDDVVASQGQVRLLCLDNDSALAGEPVGVKPSDG